MADITYGYVRGPQVLVTVPVAAASADIKRGDMITISSGYGAQASAGDAIFGFCVDEADSPSANGGASVSVDISTSSIYRYPIDTGTVAQTNLTNAAAADVGGAQSVDVTSPSNNDLRIVVVEADTNTFLVQRA